MGCSLSSFFFCFIYWDKDICKQTAGHCVPKTFDCSALFIVIPLSKLWPSMFSWRFCIPFAFCSFHALGVCWVEENDKCTGVRISRLGLFFRVQKFIFDLFFHMFVDVFDLYIPFTRLSGSSF